MMETHAANLSLLHSPIPADAGLVNAAVSRPLHS